MIATMPAGTGAATRLWALGAPTLTIDAKVLYPGRPAGLITMPCPYFLVEHSHGLVLFDTGPDPEAANDPVGVYGEQFVTSRGMRLSPEDCVDHQLRAIGFSLDDVQVVVASHLHFDHAGALHLFRSARLVLGAGELVWARAPGPAQHESYRQMEIDRVADERWTEVVDDLDLFGDGAILLLRTPGHTPGELSAVVQLGSGAFILTGDTVHDHRQMADETALAADADPAQSVESIRRLATIVRERKATLWVAHDPVDWDRFPHAPQPIC